MLLSLIGVLFVLIIDVVYSQQAMFSFSSVKSPNSEVWERWILLVYISQTS